MTRKRSVRRIKSGGRKRDVTSKSEGIIDYTPGSLHEDTRGKDVREQLLDGADKGVYVHGGWDSRKNRSQKGTIYITSIDRYLKVTAEDRAAVAEALMARVWSNVRVDSILIDDDVALFRITFTKIPSDISQEAIDRIRYSSNHSFDKMFGKSEIIDTWLKDDEYGMTAVVINSWNRPIYLTHQENKERHEKIMDMYRNSGMVFSERYAINQLANVLEILERRHNESII